MPGLLLLGLLLIFVTRLPILVGPNLVLDGDEALLGLMARHLIQNGELPLFFWGQAYGFALPEASSGALMFLLFGESDVALRLGMLLIWCVGWGFALLTLREMGGYPAFALLLVCCPAWSFWSMAARGGYVTAFLLTQLSLWLAARAWRAPPAEPPPTLLLVLLGLCQGLLLHAQALWVLVMLPFAARLLLRQGWRWRVSACGTGWLLGVLPLKFLAPTGAAVVHTPPAMFAVIDPLGALAVLPGKVYSAMTGSYFFDQGAAVGGLSAVGGLLWCLVLLGCLGHAGSSLIRRQRADLARTCSLSVLLLCGVSLVIDPGLFHPRYLLPLAGILSLYIGGQLSRLFRFRSPRLAIVLACVIGGGGVASLLGTGQRARLQGVGIDATALREGIREAIGVLDREQIKHLHCCQFLLQWQVAFYSQERIVTRSLRKRDRYPAYLQAIAESRRDGKRQAVLGWFTDTELIERLNQSVVDRQNLVLCGQQLFLILDPRPELMAWMGFEQD